MSILPLRVSRALGRMVATGVWLIGGRGRRVTQRNIEIAYPHLPSSEQKQLARASLCALGELSAEMGRVWLRPWSELQQRIISISGQEYVQEALNSGRGVIVLVPHLGNWEVLGLYLASLGETVSLYQPPKLAGLGKLIRAARERSGAQLVPPDHAGLRRMLQCARGKGIVGILPDQVPVAAAGGNNAPFMGQTCFTPTLPLRLLQQSDAVGVYAYAKRVPQGFAIVFRPVDVQLYSSDDVQALAALNAGIESCVSDCPEQYQWHYKRFRTLPRSPLDLYDGL